MRPHPVPDTPPFDLEAAERRTADLLLAMLTLRPGGADEQTQARLAGQVQQSVRENAELVLEVRRLYGALRALRDRHLPHAGEPGAEVICTGCSLHGNHMLWPCEVYTAATAALAQRRP